MLKCDTTSFVTIVPTRRVSIYDQFVSILHVSFPSFLYYFCRLGLGLTASYLIQQHRIQCLPVDAYDCVHMVVRRKYVLPDTLHQLRCGLDVSKHLRVTFVGEPAVDSGGPMREYLHLLMSSIAHNNSLFCGEDSQRIPEHNVVELEKNLYRINFCTFPCSWGAQS